MNAPVDPSERIAEIFREILALSGKSVATGGGQTSEVGDQRAEGSETDVQGLPKSQSENRKAFASRRPTPNSEGLREQAPNVER
jgi:hypothetical protein